MTTSPPVRRRRRGRWVRRGLAGTVVAVVATWAVWAHAVIQTPRTDAPAAVDAVLVLGGLLGPERTERALALAHAGFTHTLVVSTPDFQEDAMTRGLCASPPAGLDVVCFEPDPSTTQGEAQFVTRLAAARGWTRIAVVTSTYHVSRTRQIVGRCFGGEVLLVPSDEHVSARTWAYQYVYQTAGYLKVWFRSGC